MMTLRAMFIALALAAACGGGGPSTGGKLRYTFDEKHIASVPVEEKQLILQAKNELERARMEQNTHEAQLEDVKTKLDIAKNEEKQAKLSLESAKREKSEADKSADRTRINNADRELRTAETGVRAAEAKMAFLKAKKEWLGKAVLWGKTAVYAKEARYELEKAKVASSRNIRPSGFKMDDYDKQNRERQERATSFKKEADGKKQEAERKRQDWSSKEKEYVNAKGGSGGSLESAAEGTSTQTPKPSTTSTDNNAVLK